MEMVEEGIKDNGEGAMGREGILVGGNKGDWRVEGEKREGCLKGKGRVKGEALRRMFKGEKGIG